MDWIKPLNTITLADQPQVGGKAAHLGAMLRAGFNVPPGFVITMDAFVEHFGTHTDPLVKPSVPRLQGELMNQVVQALVAELGDASQLAVRSSSSDEDSQHLSFAGQHSTYYFISPQRLDEAIINCWMSLWSEAALAYRRAGWDSVMSGQPARMAVIVQQMLDADRAGVIFSRDPIRTESSESVIEACWGLGASMVDGRITPDQFRVDDHEQIVHRHVSDKKFQVLKSRDNEDGQRLQEVSATQRMSPVLTDAEILKLANIGAQLETLFEFPQDIEWAFQDKTLYVLQSRPISTFPGYHEIDDRLVLFKPLYENFTDPLTPMSADLYGQTVPNIGAFYQGRVYLRYDLINTLNPFELTDNQLVNAILLKPVDGEYKVSFLRALKTLGLLGAAFLVDGVNWLRTGWLESEDLHRYRILVDKIANNTKYNAQQTLKRLIWSRHPLEPMSAQMLYCNVSAGRYFLLIFLLRRLVTRWLPEYDLAKLDGLFYQDEEIAPLQLIYQLQSLGDLLEETLSSDLIADQEHIGQLRSILAGESHTLPQDAVFTRAFEAFLNEFGHRGPQEMELASPRWRETPGRLLNLIYSSKSMPSRAQASEADVHAKRLLARDELHQQLRPWQRRIVNHLAGKIRKYIAMRENTRQHHVMAFSATRQKLIDMEQQLIATRRLTIPGDIFFLNFSEALALQKGALAPEEAHLLVRRRRRRWQHQKQVNPPATINLDTTPADMSQGADLVGQCASPGTAEGKVRVLNSIDEHKQLQPGEILVAPFTDPAWTPLFIRASGIVVQTGSYLSHAGTLARELHIPCIVDVDAATARLRTGDHIALDANNGTITMITASENAQSIAGAPP